MRFVSAIAVALILVVGPAFAAQAPPSPATGADLLTAVTSDISNVAADTAAIAAAQVKLVNDQATLATDTGAFVGFLKVQGPSFSSNPDGSITIYSANSSVPTGYSVTTALPLSAPIPAAPATVAPAAPSS